MAPTRIGAAAVRNWRRWFFRVPFWFGAGLAAYAGRDGELPFDQHVLKALVAPRALLTCEAWGDLWANPSGTLRTHHAAREVYRLLGAPDRIGIAFRDGPHNHGPDDWRVALDFMESQLGRCSGELKPRSA